MRDRESLDYEAIGRYVVKHARWIRHEHEHYAAAPVTLGANLESPGMRFAALLTIARVPEQEQQDSPARGE